QMLDKVLRIKFYAISFAHCFLLSAFSIMHLALVSPAGGGIKGGGFLKVLSNKSWFIFFKLIDDINSFSRRDRKGSAQRARSALLCVLCVFLTFESSPCSLREKKQDKYVC